MTNKKKKKSNEECASVREWAERKGKNQPPPPPPPADPLVKSFHCLVYSIICIAQYLSLLSTSSPESLFLSLSLSLFLWCSTPLLRCCKTVHQSFETWGWRSCWSWGRGWSWSWCYSTYPLCCKIFHSRPTTGVVEKRITLCRRCLKAYQQRLNPTSRVFNLRRNHIPLPSSLSMFQARKLKKQKKYSSPICHFIKLFISCFYF